MDNKNTNNETQFETKSREKSQKKERMVVTFSAAMVITALTITGIYMNNKNAQDNTNLEDSTELEGDMSGDVAQVPGLEDGIDLQIVDSTTVENPGRTGLSEGTEETGDTDSGDTVGNTSSSTKKPATKSSNTLVSEDTQINTEAVMSEFVEAMTLSFNGIQLFGIMAEESEVIIPYSMDKAVYFETLDQYKYSPAMVMAAEVGTPVCAVSAGRITDKYWSYETGWTFEMDLGGGFKAYYGQLNNDTLEKEVDTYVAAGDVLGYVDTPTKYYAEEGSNIYFAMTRDDQPVYPLDYVGE